MDWRNGVEDDKIIVRKKNEVYLHITTTPSIHAEISDFFQFETPNAKFDPRVKARTWDGIIRLYNRRDCTLYIGLLKTLKDFAEEREYKLEILVSESQEVYPKVTLEEINTFFENLYIPKEIVPQVYDFQLPAVAKALNARRALLLSATASGKSLIIYTIIRYALAHILSPNEKILIIVPGTSLVSQMRNDFESYSNPFLSSFSPDHTFHEIYSGQEKDSPCPVFISTWQSLQQMPPSYFAKFKMVIVDEAHGCKAKVFTKILSSMTQTPYRLGFTGTLDNIAVHELQIQGLLGQTYVASRARDLIDKNILPELYINVITLSYPDEVRKSLRALSYREEIEYLYSLKKRNQFIVRLAARQKKNTLVLFREVKNHGQQLVEMAKQYLAAAGDTSRKVYYIHGKIDSTVREEVRQIVDQETDAIIFASEGCFAQGINIKSLDVLIFASPSKARIRIIQSIGRILRRGKTTTEATVYDIVDDISWKSQKNFAVQHFLDRVKIYDSERHRYKILEINFGVKDMPVCHDEKKKRGQRTSRSKGKRPRNVVVVKSL